MSSHDLITGWLLLVILSAATVLVTATGIAGPSRSIAAVTVLILAGLKARIILARYLALKKSPFWLRGFQGAISIFIALIFAIYSL